MLLDVRSWVLSVCMSDLHPSVAHWSRGEPGVSTPSHTLFLVLWPTGKIIQDTQPPLHFWCCEHWWKDHGWTQVSYCSRRGYLHTHLTKLLQSVYEFLLQQPSLQIKSLLWETCINRKNSLIATLDSKILDWWSHGFRQPTLLASVLGQQLYAATQL